MTENVIIVGTENLEEVASLVPTGSVTVAVHSGPFHADEVFACALLLWTDRYHSPTIIRTRNAEIIGQAELAADVGGDYDPERLRFDHH